MITYTLSGDERKTVTQSNKYRRCNHTRQIQPNYCMHTKQTANEASQAGFNQLIYKAAQIKLSPNSKYE
jgi:hypothetical protein